jgi:hypothetical protein
MKGLALHKLATHVNTCMRFFRGSMEWKQSVLPFFVPGTDFSKLTRRPKYHFDVRTWLIMTFTFACVCIKTSSWIKQMIEANQAFRIPIITFSLLDLSLDHTYIQEDDLPHTLQKLMWGLLFHLIWYCSNWYHQWTKKYFYEKKKSVSRPYNYSIFKIRFRQT